jgi:hypothetical protein
MNQSPFPSLLRFSSILTLPAPTFTAAKPFAVSKTAGDFDRTAIRALISPFGDLLKIFVAFRPFFPATLASDRADIAGKVTVFNPNRLAGA